MIQDSYYLRRVCFGVLLPALHDQWSESLIEEAFVTHVWWHTIQHSLNNLDLVIILQDGLGVDEQFGPMLLTYSKSFGTADNAV